MVKEYVPKLKEKYHPHITIINGENAAGGRGITEKIYRGFLEAVHKPLHWEIIHGIIVKSLNLLMMRNILLDQLTFLKNNPGQGIVYLKMNEDEIAVINLQGRIFLPANECPFQKADELIEEAKERTSIIFVDFHAEATSEKMRWDGI